MCFIVVVCSWICNSSEVCLQGHPKTSGFFPSGFLEIKSINSFPVLAWWPSYHLCRLQTCILHRWIKVCSRTFLHSLLWNKTKCSKVTSPGSLNIQLPWWVSQIVIWFKLISAVILEASVVWDQLLSHWQTYSCYSELRFESFW